MSLSEDHIQWDSLVDRQLRLWHEKQKSQQQALNERPNPWETAHVTISRNYGSRGFRIGEVLAEKLRWQVYSRSLVEYIADRSNLREKIIADFDEKKKSRTISQTLFEPSSYSADKHYRHLIQVILSVADHGQAVIIGRGANFIADPSRGLHVRVTASLESRIERYANKQKVSFKEAKKKVESVDKERADYIKLHFRHDVEDPHHYDLVLNVENFENEQVADMMIAALEIKLGCKCPILTPEKDPVMEQA